jgi:transcription antitermination protein NusB
MARSRRKAREAALQTLYEIEVGKTHPVNALQNTMDAGDLEPELAAYARRIVEGVRSHERELDSEIAPLVQGYEYDRLATVDRNVLRIAAYELYHEPGIPPAVSINEAIEVAKKFSTAESGRFVNGVLGKLVQQSPKATWDPASAPPEHAEELIRGEEPEVEEAVVEAGSEEAERLSRIGGWKLRESDE